MKKAALVLADGTVFEGYQFGAEKDAPVTGEVVFNTSMTGYQEILTDPSYTNQMVCFTYPHIGNVGCNPEDMESDKVQVEGVIIKELTKVTSNFRAKESLDAFLKRFKTMGIYGINTRALVTHLRDNGSQMGALGCLDKVSIADLEKAAKAATPLDGLNLADKVSCTKPYTWNESTWDLATNSYKKFSDKELASRPHVVAIDCGIKYNILRLLVAAGFRVTVVPSSYSTDDILKLKPAGVFLSNGPGDPAACTKIIETVKGLLSSALPLFGICLGHQIMALASGAKTYKLKFGHHGGNQPVRNETTKAVEITAQNHGFAVEPKTMTGKGEVSHINLNDMTVEGITMFSNNAFAVQYHPEASPGPHDAEYLFNKFYELVANN